MTPAKIMVVDNLEDQLFLARTVFESQGYTIVTCANADCALKHLAENKDIDLILSDINMPDKDGFDFIKEVRQNADWRSIPFVFLTASYWTDAVRREGLSLGATKFIFRPVEPRALVTEVEDALPPEKRSSGRTAP
jgi:two-component system cell cycle response regulator